MVNEILETEKNIVENLKSLFLNEEDLMFESFLFLKRTDIVNQDKIEELLKSENFLSSLKICAHEATVLGVNSLILQESLSFQNICTLYLTKNASLTENIKSVLVPEALALFIGLRHEIFSKILSQHKDLSSSTISSLPLSNRKIQFLKAINEN